MKKKILITTILLALLGIILIVVCRSKESEADFINPEKGSFTDPRDGKIYKTVKIGDQWIMAENLAYKPDKGNYWAYEDDESNIPRYGYLYDWETAMNIAPEGWHLPSRDEWNAIHKTLGAKWSVFYYLEKIYPKMIVGGSSGLDMLFGGLRTCSGEFKGLGDKARFWTSRNSSSDKACTGLDRNIEGYPHGLWGSKAPYAYNNGYQKTCPGYNVRLFKD